MLIYLNETSYMLSPRVTSRTFYPVYSHICTYTYIAICLYLHLHVFFPNWKWDEKKLAQPASRWTSPRPSEMTAQVLSLRKLGNINKYKEIQINNEWGVLLSKINAGKGIGKELKNKTEAKENHSSLNKSSGFCLKLASHILCVSVTKHLKSTQHIKTIRSKEHSRKQSSRLPVKIN